jgi:hypothetical protein
MKVAIRMKAIKVEDAPLFRKEFENTISQPALSTHFCFDIVPK